MRNKIKREIIRGLEEDILIVLDKSTGEVYSDIKVSGSNKQVLTINFIKMGIDKIEELIECLGKEDHYSFLYLCMKMSSNNIVDVKVLDKLYCKDVRMRKVRRLKKHGLLVRKKLSNMKYSHYFINPYFCQKDSSVWVDVVDLFKSKLLFVKNKQ